MTLATPEVPDNARIVRIYGKVSRCAACDRALFVPSKSFAELVYAWTCFACKKDFPIDNSLERFVEVQKPTRNDWMTPDLPWLAIHREYRFNLDIAASADNTKTPRFFDGSHGKDSLKDPWLLPDGSPARCWCNPPYNPKGTIQIWLERAVDQASKGVFSVFLIPMSSSLGWFNDIVVPFAEWQTFKGRIKFLDPLANLQDNARNHPKQDNLLVIFDPLSNTIGHTAIRDSRTGERLWTRPDVVNQMSDAA